jgi:phenylalanyl-tRNA synthetase beta chain
VICPAEVLLDASRDVGARNSRRLLALYSDKKSGFEVIHGVLDRIMVVTGAADSKKNDAGYQVEPSAEPAYFPGRQARVFRDGEAIGIIGVVHPDVLRKFDISTPCSVLELDLEPLLRVDDANAHS